MLHKKTLALITGILVLAIIASSFVYLNSQKLYTGDIEPISLGVYPSEYNSLIYIANDQHYFSNNGLDVTFKTYPSGATAVRGMLNNEVDISMASEFVVASNALEKANIYAFGSVSKYLNVYLVARTDRGINSVSDLEGKRIGVSLGTALQFYLGRYLEVNGIDQSQTTLINLNFTETPAALANASVDAVVTFQPYISQIQSLLPDKTLVLPIQSNQFGYFEAMCSRDFLAAHPDLIVRFLKALIQAESFNINHPAQAISLVAKDLNYTNNYAASVWPDYQYSVTLDQSFVLLMQEEARWLISNNLTSATSIPNFLDYLYVDGLKGIRPESVNIIGLGD
jgi:NitT/TauT family transport system substrate-binding protein